MRQSQSIPAFESRTHASYEVRVRGTMYLWGSSHITKDLTFNQPLLLHIRNNVFGEIITVGTLVASGATSSIGELYPGECVSISIQTISGVFATCTLESTVDCLIEGRS